MNNNYVNSSLELHLFFARIMKEHSLFLRAGFTPADMSFSRKAEFYKNEFESLLCDAVAIANGTRHEVLNSGEIVTEFTALAEKQTENFTGININKQLTQRELRLNSGNGICESPANFRRIRELNRRAVTLLNGLIAFKEEILNRVLSCRMFTMNYPLLIEHIIREAKLYRSYISELERTGRLDCRMMQDTESFWNRIMMEHALFIRGLLDPTEGELIELADGFAADFSELLESCRQAQDMTLAESSLEHTIKLRDFKATGAAGIQQCKIRSVILPLLADHVLREANHYIRILKD